MVFLGLFMLSIFWTVFVYFERNTDWELNQSIGKKYVELCYVFFLFFVVDLDYFKQLIIYEIIEDDQYMRFYKYLKYCYFFI